MNQMTLQLPAPSGKHATCAWCRRDFDTIVDLIDHVDNGHLETTPIHGRSLDEAA